MDIQNVLTEIMSNYQKKENEIFETALRTMATPPVKGEITKGKLKWRGIVLCQQNNGLEMPQRWLEQRGKQISPKVSMAPINFDKSPA